MIDPRLSDFPPREESDTDKTTRIGSMMVTGVYLGVLAVAGVTGLGAHWNGVCKAIKRWFGRGRG